MGGARKLGLALVLGLLLVAAGGCGDSTSQTETEADASQLYPFLKGPAREFVAPGGDNALPLYGQEASRAERDQASRVITAWMRARAAKDWVDDCRYMSRSYRRNLVQEDAYRVTNGRVKNCPQALAYFGSAASGDGKNTLTGPIDSLRIEEDQAYALWHGKRGIDWALPMNREDGKWKVSLAAPIERK